MVFKNNGYLSKEIELHSGLRQGCPISALIFILCVEIMAIKLRENPNIIGFDFKSKNVQMISQYAVDSTLTLTKLESVDESIMNLLSIYKGGANYCFLAAEIGTNLSSNHSRSQIYFLVHVVHEMVFTNFKM